jgi:hypothetical protein
MLAVGFHLCSYNVTSVIVIYYLKYLMHGQGHHFAHFPSFEFLSKLFWTKERYENALGTTYVCKLIIHFA